MENELRFEVVALKNGMEVELYHEGFGPLLSPCEWARECPHDGDYKVKCKDCLANKKFNIPRMTHKEGIEWWKSAGF